MFVALGQLATSPFEAMNLNTRSASSSNLLRISSRLFPVTRAGVSKFFEFCITIRIHWIYLIQKGCIIMFKFEVIKFQVLEGITAFAIN